MLYNIRYATGGKRRPPWSGYLKRTTDHLHAISRFVQEYDPDVLGLVEVDAGSFRMRQQHQAEIIAADLGHHHAYRSKYRDRGLWPRIPVLNQQGNAFVTRDEIERATFHDFAHGFKSLVIELELEQVNVYLVHLSLRFRARQHQMADLFHIVEESTKPVIVAGDFNAFRGDRETRLFLAATRLKSANVGGDATFPSWAPKRELDFVLHSPELRLTRCEVPKVRHSDHLPMVCDFDVDA